MDDQDYHLNKRLDGEFRRILRVIKPYIPCIMNNEYLTSYRLWLEKLSGVGPSEKEERNRYVMELCYQIQDGILEYPFTQLPTDGPLPPFSPDSQITQQVDNNVNYFPIPLSSQQKHGSYSNYNVYNTIDNTIENTQQATNNLHYNFGSNNSLGQSTPKRRNPHTLSKNPSLKLPEGFHNLIKSYGATSPPSKPNHPNNNLPDKYMYAVPSATKDFAKPIAIPEKYIVKEDIEAEGSWCDMTDLSASTATKSESVDSASTPKNPTNDDSQELYEKKITELMKIINDLQKQNVKLNENVMNYEHAITMRNANAETSIHNLVGEVNSLKSRLQELKDIKSALKSSQAMAANQWQTTITTLTEELDSAHRQNTILRDEIAVLERKFSELTAQQKKENSLCNQRINAKKEKEIEILKQNHQKQIQELEDKFNKRINEIQVEYENKILQLQVKYEKIIQDKDKEIQRLENLIEVQCKRMHNEVTSIRAQMEESRDSNNESNSEKIVFLQKCITKMDRLFKKSERSFIKQIAKLKTEIEMRDKIIHIQLSSQRAELIANSNTEKQIEIDATIVQLEERYRRLLESQQTYFVNEKDRKSVV